MATPAVSEALECSVCLLSFNTSDRLPKVLTCRHTICGACVDRIKSTTSIKCPTCRDESELQKVGINYTVKSIIEELCAACASQKQSGKCAHCQQDLCGVCLESHRQGLHKDLLEKLDELDEKVKHAMNIYLDDSMLKSESEHAGKAIEELQRQREELETGIRQTKAANLAKQTNWKKSLIFEITQIKDFCSDARNKFDMDYNKNLQTSELMSSLCEQEERTSKLAKMMANSPKFDEYRKQMISEMPLSQRGTMVSVVPPVPPKPHKTQGTMTLDISPTVTPKLHPRPQGAVGPVGVPDYTALRHGCWTGTKGSQLDQFDLVYSAACIGNMIVVVDSDNHRLKWYDCELNPLFAVGTKGSGQSQFCDPFSVAAGPNDELFVSDVANNRVTVISKNGEYRRQFGTEGTGKKNFHWPGGIAIRGDDLFVCDTCNYRIKHLTTNGKFVKHIGSKGTKQGQFDDKPIRIAVMSPSDGRILVNVLNKLQLFVFDKKGSYQGLFPPVIPPKLSESLITDVCVDDYNNVLVTYKSGQLVVYNPRGDLLHVYGSKGTNQGQFLYPWGVTVNHARKFVCVCDRDNSRLVRLDFDNLNQS